MLLSRVEDFGKGFKWGLFLNVRHTKWSDFLSSVNISKTKRLRQILTWNIPPRPRCLLNIKLIIPEKKIWLCWNNVFSCCIGIKLRVGLYGPELCSRYGQMLEKYAHFWSLSIQNGLIFLSFANISKTKRPGQSLTLKISPDLPYSKIANY